MIILTIISFKLISLRMEPENLSNAILEKGLCYSCKTELLCLQIRGKLAKKNWSEIVKRAKPQRYLKCVIKRHFCWLHKALVCLFEKKQFQDKYLRSGRHEGAICGKDCPETHRYFEILKVNLKCNCEIPLCTSATAAACEKKPITVVEWFSQVPLQVYLRDGVLPINL